MADLAAKLPVGYEYVKVDTSHDSYQIRVKDIKTEEEAYGWLENYSDLTMTTWRINKTYPHSGRINIFKRYFRCQRKTDGRHRGQLKRTSKNTGCPAQIEIVIKRYNPRSRSKYPDKWTEEFPTSIRFRKNHNHSICDEEDLKHRDMSVDTREKLISLFRAGHAPSSARNFLKMELMLNHPESYSEKLLDAHFVPSISVVTHLYKTILHEVDNETVANSSTRVTARELRAMQGMQTTQPVHAPKSRMTKKSRSINSVSVVTVAEIAVDEVNENVDHLDRHSPEPHVVSDVDDDVTICSHNLTDLNVPFAAERVNNAVLAVDELFNRIKQGVSASPEFFIPAIEEMQHNLSMYATTDRGLLDTLRTMGLPLTWVNFPNT